MATLDKEIIKPLEEVVNRYAETALISAVRLRRYWMSQGDSEERAIAKAVKQVVGLMTSSGVPPEKLYELFDELEETCRALKSMLREVIKGR